MGGPLIGEYPLNVDILEPLVGSFCPQVNKEDSLWDLSF